LGTFNYNKYNIQGEFINLSKNKTVAENECGELVVYRIMNKNLSDLEFYEKCMKVGPEKIFKTVKMLEKI
ncbi:MAG: hypothetical protein NZZ41_08085, partial [Candidatus Dojkabacteria bacterium]|nr:hypothetical protein [Candidatus Dojkabacteria bacterium]